MLTKIKNFILNLDFNFDWMTTKFWIRLFLFLVALVVISCIHIMLTTKTINEAFVVSIIGLILGLIKLK